MRILSCATLFAALLFGAIIAHAECIPPLTMSQIRCCVSPDHCAVLNTTCPSCYWTSYVPVIGSVILPAPDRQVDGMSPVVPRNVSPDLRPRRESYVGFRSVSAT